MRYVAATLVIAGRLLIAPALSEGGVYVYSEVDGSTDGSYIYVSAVAIAISDDPEPGVWAYAILYDPSFSELKANLGSSGGWDVVVYGDNVALGLGAAVGTYNAKGVGWGSSSGTACSPYSPVTISAYRHHYDFAAMGNPNTYNLASDSTGRMCSHSSLTWDTTSLSGLTDSGLVLHFGSFPAGCLAQCTAGKTGNVIGPAGTTLGSAACG
jgi:hypothetical protein